MSLPSFDLKDKVAIVTGSGRGLGKVLALGLAEAGAYVAVCARTATDIEATAEEIRTLGRRALAMPIDVRRSDQVEELVRRTLEEFGAIDILVNNAGGSPPTPSLDMSERFWDAVINGNLKSAFLCSRAVAKVWVEQKRGGVIINLASLAGRPPSPELVAYGAAKAGIINLTASLAVEWAPYGIRVNAIAPGVVETGPPGQPLWGEDFRKTVPMRRIGQPEEIVGTVLYLASDASEYVTGETIFIDGGPRGWIPRWSGVEI